MPGLKNKEIPFISAIFPNYNGGEFILETIKSLLESAYPYSCLEIIMVDNRSTDESCSLVKSHFANQIKEGKIKLIELNRNAGAPYAYNMGIKMAKADYDFILKIDNDLIVEVDCINELLKPFFDSPDIGVTGGKVFYYSQKERLHLIGSRISPFFAGGRGVGKYRIDHNKFNVPLYFDAVNGCMMLIKREVFEKVGLMDENYFLYFDDIDLSLRATNAGFKHFYCYKARAYHNTATPNKRFQSKRWLRYAIYNSFYFMKKNYKGMDVFIFFLAINLNMARYIAGVILNNKFNMCKNLLNVIFSSYADGLVLFLKK